MDLVIHLDSTLGVAYIGNVLAAVLFGATCVQTIIFFNSRRRDNVSLKVIVLALWFLDALHLCLVSHTVYYYSVSNRSLSALLRATWSVLAQIFATCAANLIVRYMFGRRLWRLSHHNKLLAIVVASLSLFVFAVGTAFGCRALEIRVFVKIKVASWMFYSSLGAAVVADCVIAISLCILFYKSRTGYVQTDTLLAVLALYSVNTGLITSLAAIICFMTYAVLPNEYYYMAVFFMLTGLNVNCLLASLNARTPLRKQISTNLSEKSPFARLKSPSSSDGDVEGTEGTIRVKVETITDVKWDTPDSLEPFTPATAV